MIRVTVIPPGPDRPNFRLQYRDPVTKRQHWRSAKTAVRREAEKAAARWEEELTSGKAATSSTITWAVFRQRYEVEALPALAHKTAKNYRTTMNLFEALCRPGRLASVTAATLSDFAAKLRAKPEKGHPRSEDSVKTYLSQLSAILGWAHRVGLLASVPKPPRIRRVRSDATPAKGRPLTEAEYQTLLVSVVSVVGEKAAPSWKHWIEGLWWSGLRLEESLNLTWDLHGPLSVDLTGRFTMLRIRRHWEKGHKDRLLPIAPEFSDFLLRTPEPDRVGKVFRLLPVEPPGRPAPSRAIPGEQSAGWVGAVCRRIGKKAGIVVDRSDTGRIKYASAHVPN